MCHLKRFTYFKTCIFKLFHKFLNILTLSCKYTVYALSPHYLRSCQYNLKNNITMNTVVLHVCWIWGSHGSNHVDYGLLSCNNIEFGGILIFQRSIFPSSLGLQKAACLPGLPCGLLLLDSHLAYPSTLKMMVICTSKTSACSRLLGITTQKIVLIMVTNVRTSNPIFTNLLYLRAYDISGLSSEIHSQIFGQNSFPFIWNSYDIFIYNFLTIQNGSMAPKELKLVFLVLWNVSGD